MAQAEATIARNSAQRYSDWNPTRDSKTFIGWTWYPVDIINLFLFGLFYLIYVDGGGEVEWKNVEKNLDFF